MKAALPASPTARLPRRVVLKWFAAAAAAMQLKPMGGVSFGASAAAPAPKGYGTDPNVAGYYKPGDFWALTLTEVERSAATALADTLLPADKLGPAASELRVIDFIDEWISAPYPNQVGDRPVVVEGLKWLDDEARSRFNQSFAALRDEQKRAICDDICWPADAKPKFKKAATFFQKFRGLAMGAYYGTEPGWAAIGYVGNVPLLQFDGPPPEVLEKLGVEQTVR